MLPHLYLHNVSRTAYVVRSFMWMCIVCHVLLPHFVCSSNEVGVSKQVDKRSDRAVILALHTVCTTQKSFWSHEVYLMYSACVQKPNVGSLVLQI